MSGRLLQKPDRPQDRADDLESFVHVIVYLVFRCQKSVIPDIDLARTMAAVYDQFVDSNIPAGGEGKRAFFLGSEGKLEPRVVNASFPAPLADLIDDLRESFAVLYWPKPLDPRRFFSAVEKQKRLAEIEDHEKRVTDASKALNNSSEKLLGLFDDALARDDWPEGENAKPAVDRLPRTAYKTGVATQIDPSEYCGSHVTKRKLYGDGDDSNSEKVDLRSTGTSRRSHNDVETSWADME